MEIKGCRAPRSCSSQAIVCHIGRSRDAGVDGRGGRAEINFSNFLASPSFPITASMTQPRWNVGSHGNPLWVLCSDGCRGCYRWSGCGGASAGNALKMVCISAVHLAEGFFFFALRFVEPCLGGRSAFGLPREPEGPACSWHTSIPNPFGRGNKSSSTGRAAKCVIISPSGCILQGLPVLAARSHPCTSGTD